MENIWKIRTISNDENPTITYSIQEQLKQASAGATAGCLTRFVTQPFDVLKIRFQLQVEPIKKHMDSKYSSLTQATVTIFREEGLKSFWKGHNCGQVMSITYALIQFWCYEQVKLAFTQYAFMRDYKSLNHFISGGLAGLLGTTLSMPFDVVRTRIVARDHDKGYNSTFEAFKTILHKEGTRGLFRGIVPTLIQIGPLIGSNFLIYKDLNQYVSQEIYKREDGMLPTWCLFVNGCIAGSGSKALVYPLDFIKKRLQLKSFEEDRITFGKSSGCDTILHCIVQTLENEGPAGFYKGIGPTLLKSGITTALYFCIYDITKLLLTKYGF